MSNTKGQQKKQIKECFLDYKQNLKSYTHEQYAKRWGWNRPDVSKTIKAWQTAMDFMDESKIVEQKNTQIDSQKKPTVKCRTFSQDKIIVTNLLTKCRTNNLNVEQTEQAYMDKSTNDNLLTKCRTIFECRTSHSIPVVYLNFSTKPFIFGSNLSISLDILLTYSLLVRKEKTINPPIVPPNNKKESETAVVNGGDYFYSVDKAGEQRVLVANKPKNWSLANEVECRDAVNLWNQYIHSRIGKKRVSSLSSRQASALRLRLAETHIVEINGVEKEYTGIELWKAVLFKMLMSEWIRNHKSAVEFDSLITNFAGNFDRVRSGSYDEMGKTVAKSSSSVSLENTMSEIDRLIMEQKNNG